MFILAESPYEQWRRLHNIKTDEVEELRESKTFQTKKKRVFKLELTDGCKTIHGMEYEMISKLNSKISPGAKLKIVGPLQVVNHILLLGPQNLTVLGGDVDHLLIVNAYENVLLRALGKPTTDTPIIDYKDEVLIIENNNNMAPRTAADIAISVSNQIQVDNILDGINFDDEDDVDMDMLMQIEQVERENTSQENNVINQPPIENGIGDDIILSQMDIEEIDMPHRAAVESAQEITSLSPSVRADRLLIAPIIIPDSYDDDLQDRNAFLAKPSSSRTSLVQSSCEYTADPVPKKIARIGPTPMISVSAEIYQYKTTNGDHLVTVDQYVLLKSGEQMKRDYVILGRVQNVTMKSLRIRENQWHLNVEIGDSYSYKLLSVKLHNKILEKLSGRSGSEIQNDYIETKTRPHIKADIEKVLERLKTKLSTLQSFMKIEIKFQQPHPSIYEVVELLDDSAENNQAYLRKIKDEKLEIVS